MAIKKTFFIIAGLLLAIQGGIVDGSVSQAEAATHTFTENFTATTYKDGTNTTATWNTGAGNLEFPFVDDGGNGSITRVQSLKVNEAVSKKITKATLTADIDMQGAGTGTSGIVIGYEMSADGGLHWDSVTWDKTEHSFDYPGYDLRWRASYSTASIYEDTPPFINEINISYKTQSALTGSLAISRIYQRTDMLKIKLEADDTEDLSLSSLTVFTQKEVDGVSGYLPVNASDISKIELYDGSVKIKGSAVINNGYITFSNLSLVIPKNSSKELTIKGEISESSNVRRHVTYLRQEIDTNGIFIDSSAPDKIVVSGVDSGLNLTIGIVGEMARGKWFYIADPPIVYPYEFTEDFSTTAYKDIANTAADWSVSDKVVRLPKDGDHYVSSVPGDTIAQSSKINTTSKMITGAKIVVDKEVVGNMGVSYSLSADGGAHWTQVIPEKENKFIYPGYDLRWKASLWTNVSNNQNSPIINSVTISYEMADTPINFLDISGGSNNPQNSNIEKGSKNVNLIEVKFTANSAEDLIISPIGFSGVREGVYWMTRDDIDGVTLYDGDVKLGEAQISDNGKFAFPNLSIRIPKGGSKTLMLKGDISDKTASKILRFGLDYNSETFPVTEADSGIKPNVRGHATGAFFYLIPNGTPIKAPNDYKIYVINDAKKKWIKTAEEFEQNYEWKDIQELDSASVDALEEVSVFSTAKLLRATGHHKVYRIINGKRLWVPTISAFNAQGLKWDEIGDVNQTEVEKYPTVKLIKAENDDRVFYITDSGLKKHIINTEVFNSYDNRWEDVVEVSSETINSLDTVNLFRNENENKVYKIEGNEKKWIKTAEVFNRMGYDWNKIVSVNTIEINAYSTGAKIN